MVTNMTLSFETSADLSVFNPDFISNLSNLSSSDIFSLFPFSDNNETANCSLPELLDHPKCKNPHPYQFIVIPMPLIITLMVLIHIVGLLGNSVVVYIVISKRRMQTYTNWMLLNLAISDLAVVIFCIPLDIPLLISKEWIYGKIFCRIYYPLGTAPLLSSAFTLVPIAFSRYWGITQPFGKQASVKFAKSLICVIWVISILLVTPIISVLKYDSSKGICFEHWDEGRRRAYTIAIFIVGYALPLMINSVAYSFVVYEVSWKVKTANMPYRDAWRLKENRMLMKLSLIVTTTFAICVLPTQLVLFLYEFGNFKNYKYHTDLRLASNLLLFLNSALNPIIYNVFSETFRSGFKEIIRGEFSSGRKRSERILSNTLTIQLKQMEKEGING